LTDLDGIMDAMLAHTRLDLRAYRRSMIERRVQSRMDRLSITDPTLYLHRMRQDPAECAQLAAAIAINVSAFFRDPLVFELLDAVVLPELLHPEGRPPATEVRAWSAGCAQGEEPYSLAILLHYATRKTRATCAARIYATDIDADALARARIARYPREALREVKLGILDAAFVPNGRDFDLRPEFRALVDFSRDDLMDSDRDAPAASVFSGFDLILCRNVLIYFEPPVQDIVLARLSRSLTPGGFLVLGESESAHTPASHGLLEFDARHHLYRKHDPARRTT